MRAVRIAGQTTVGVRRVVHEVGDAGKAAEEDVEGEAAEAGEGEDGIGEVQTREVMGKNIMNTGEEAEGDEAAEEVDEDVSLYFRVLHMRLSSFVRVGSMARDEVNLQQDSMLVITSYCVSCIGLVVSTFFLVLRCYKPRFTNKEWPSEYCK